ncbi:MAG: homoserine kinase [Cytophagaceae bacterium]|nr:homoserine kinase [Cytophagaceae bacterium]
MAGSDSIRVFAPATVANVTCGFDVLGFAVNNPGDEIILRKTDTDKIVIKAIHGDGGRLTLDPNFNTVSIPVIKYLEKYGIKQGLEIELFKHMPLGSGLGSSAASSVAGVFAVDKLLGLNKTVEEMLPFAMEGELIACGAAHADNVAPCLYGGFVLVRSYNPLEIVRINTPQGMYCSLVHPHVEVQTKDARNALPKEIPLGTAVTQWGNVAGLVAGLMKSDFGLIGRSMQDVVAEPARAGLIPGFYSVKENALNAGAIGAGISGSGPSIFALSDSLDKANMIAEAMAAAFKKIGIGSETYVSEVNHQGPVVME